MENEQLFELLSKIYDEMQEIKTEVKEIKTDVKDIKGRVVNIEKDHGKKIDMLLYVYKQNAEQLNRIEKIVSKQEEFILKRVK